MDATYLETPGPSAALNEANITPIRVLCLRRMKTYRNSSDGNETAERCPSHQQPPRHGRVCLSHLVARATTHLRDIRTLSNHVCHLSTTHPRHAFELEEAGSWGAVGGVRSRIRQNKKSCREKLVVPCWRAIAAAARTPPASPNYRRARPFSCSFGAQPRVRERACVSNHGCPSPGNHTSMIMLPPRTRTIHAVSTNTRLRPTQSSNPRMRTATSALPQKPP